MTEKQVLSFEPASRLEDVSAEHHEQVQDGKHRNDAMILPHAASLDGSHFRKGQVLADRWHGKGTIWIAPEEAGGEITPFPAGYDHLRALPVRQETPGLAISEEATPS